MGQTKWRREGKNISSAKLSKKKSFVSFFVKVFLSKCVKNKKVEKKWHMFSWIILKKLICFFMVEIEWKLISRIFFFSCVKLRKKVSSGRKSETKFKKKKKKKWFNVWNRVKFAKSLFFLHETGWKKSFFKGKKYFFFKEFFVWHVKNNLQKTVFFLLKKTSENLRMKKSSEKADKKKCEKNDKKKKKSLCETKFFKIVLWVKLVEKISLSKRNLKKSSFLLHETVLKKVFDEILFSMKPSFYCFLCKKKSATFFFSPKKLSSFSAFGCTSLFVVCC